MYLISAPLLSGAGPNTRSKAKKTKKKKKRCVLSLQRDRCCVCARVSKAPLFD